MGAGAARWWRSGAARAALGALALLALAPAAQAHHPSARVDAAAIPVLPPSPPGGPPSIDLQAQPAQLRYGRPVRLFGTARNVAPGTAVSLYLRRSNQPPQLLQTKLTGPTGAYAFTDYPDRNSNYVVVLGNFAAQAQTLVRVSTWAKWRTWARPLGRAELWVLVIHARDLPWNHQRVSWWVSSGGRFHRFPATRSIRLGPQLTLLRTVLTLPAGRFRWRACFHAPEDHALVDPRQPPGCSGQGYYGSGWLPYGYPRPAAVARAKSFLSRRAGRTAFAVVDSEGRISGWHEHWTFVSASVVKAMLLVSYLRWLHHRHQHYVDANSNSFLYPMINQSDNSAATATWSIVGDGALYRLAHQAGMTDFSISGIWANAQISAADQARFFFYMDSLIPREFVGYARRLLSTIVDYESWGIPAVARPRGYRVFFKGGWRTTGLGQLVHQVARLEGHHRRMSLAVMTDGDPDMGYGIGTIQGLTGTLLWRGAT